MAAYKTEASLTAMILEQGAKIDSLTEAVEACNRGVQDMDGKLTWLIQDASMGAGSYHRSLETLRGSCDRRARNHRDTDDLYEDARSDGHSNDRYGYSPHRNRSYHGRSRSLSRYHEGPPLGDDCTSPPVRHLADLRSTTSTFNNCISYRRYSLRLIDPSTGIHVSKTTGQYGGLLPNNRKHSTFIGPNPI